MPEVISRLVPERSRERGNTTFHKRLIGGGDLIIVGANAPAPLRSSPINFALLDEVSAFPGTTDEGDVLDLVAARQYTYAHTAKTLLTSTPLDEGTCRITRAYLETNQQRYFVPCLACGTLFVITFADIQYPADEPEKAVLVCPNCGGVHTDYDKPEQLRHGEWRPTVSSGDPSMSGYSISGLYSPWLRYGAIATHHRKVAKDPVRLRVFVNTVLAETWKVEDGEGIDQGGLPARREDLSGPLPPWVVVLTCGVDVQADRLECTLIAWGAGERCAVLEHRVLWGDPSAGQVWADLDALLSRTFSHSLAVPDLSIRATCVDTGGAHTLATYSWLKGKAARRIWGIKGSSTPAAPLWPKKATTNTKGKLPIFMVGVNAGKETIYSRLKVTESGPGHIAFDNSLSTDYFTQLTAERVRTRYSRGHPVREWVLPDGRRNEALDCAVYALAALYGLRSMGLNLDREAASQEGVPPRVSAQAITMPAPVHKPAAPIRSQYISTAL
ncbi:Phage terminase, large subunit [Azospirillum argentinense]|uniref:Phage terminase large subunit GpA-like protein n=1 Tax=Azospirillum argentinense TaxID=2970906 RepID=A0A5B0KMA8_9PROT|nr:Phage terminase, large subunit [Azospirillum argentinense]